MIDQWVDPASLDEVKVDVDVGPSAAKAKAKAKAAMPSPAVELPTGGSSLNGSGTAGKIRVRGMRYNMKVFFEQCVEQFQSVAPGYELKHVDTPFIDEDVGIENPIPASEAGARFHLP